MQQIFGALGVVLLGGFGWLSLEFLGRPIRSFLDLRREIRRQLIYIGDHGSEEGVATLRDLGAQAIAFEQGEWLAAKCIRLFRIYPIQAGQGLLALSQMFENLDEREHGIAKIEDALRFSHRGDMDWQHLPE